MYSRDKRMRQYRASYGCRPVSARSTNPAPRALLGETRHTLLPHNTSLPPSPSLSLPPSPLPHPSLSPSSSPLSLSLSPPSSFPLPPLLPPSPSPSLSLSLPPSPLPLSLLSSSSRFLPSFPLSSLFFFFFFFFFFFGRQRLGDIPAARSNRIEKSPISRPRHTWLVYEDTFNQESACLPAPCSNWHRFRVFLSDLRAREDARRVTCQILAGFHAFLCVFRRLHSQRERRS